LFFLGLAAGDEAFSQKYIFPGDRQENKERATEAALNMLRQYLLAQVNKSKKAV
jgi:nicotinamide mononucleotide (NMN) deamidase PncC